MGLAASEVSGAAGLTPEAVERVWRDIAAKRRTTAYLHEPPLLVEPLPPQRNLTSTLGS